MFTNTQLKEIFEQTYNRNNWLEVLRENLGVQQLYQHPKGVAIKSKNDERKLAEEYYPLSKLTTEEGREIGIYEVAINANIKLERNKIGLRSLKS